MTHIDVKKCEQLTIDDILNGEYATLDTSDYKVTVGDPYEEVDRSNTGVTTQLDDLVLRIPQHERRSVTTTELIRQWAIDRNLHTADPNKQVLKLGEEFGELFEGLAKGDADLTKDALGDMFVVMTILSQQLGFTIEECIDLAYNEIKDRKGRMIDGVFVKESDLKEDE